MNIASNMQIVDNAKEVIIPRDTKGTTKCVSYVRVACSVYVRKDNLGSDEKNKPKILMSKENKVQFREQTEDIKRRSAVISLMRCC